MNKEGMSGKLPPHRNASRMEGKVKNQGIKLVKKMRQKRP